MTTRHDVRISGFGGQGVVLSGYILGKAAAIYDGQHSAFTQSYGPEARGGACCATIAVSTERLDYPLVNEADYFVALAKEAYEKYADFITPSALTFVDVDLVKEATVDNVKILGIPATRMADEMGYKIIANILMLGFFIGVTKIISVDAMKKGIETTVKKAFVELNLKAFDMGYEYAQEIVAGATPALQSQDV